MMAPRTWTKNALITALTLGGLAVGCGTPPKPTPKPPAEESAKWEDSGGGEASPKKCEALSEKCTATSSTKARIAKSSLAVTPMAGWTYAQGENATVAQASDTGAVMVVVGYESANAKEDIKSREAALDAASKEAGVTLPKKKIGWKAPADTKEISGVKVGIFEADGATRKDKKGALLVFAGTMPENKGIVGFGFVPDDDKDADKIVEGLQTSIGTLAPHAEKTDGKK